MFASFYSSYYFNVTTRCKNVGKFMSDEKFYKIILAICVIWAFSVAGLIAYTFDLQSKCSIISYIANGK